MSSALFWLEQFHVDGLRVDGVASMLYRDYGRKAGEWIPNAHGGHEYFEAVELLQRLNDRDRARATRHDHGRRGVDRVAARHGRRRTAGSASRTSGTWAGCTTRSRISRAIRSIASTTTTSSRCAGMYAWSERFVLPLSHDEVVHGKGALIAKLPGDAWQRFATLRLLYAYMYSQPGKKLLFMGDEFAQDREWNHDAQPRVGAARAARARADPAARRRAQPDVSRHPRAPRARLRARRVSLDRSPTTSVNSVLSYERLARDGSSVVCAFNFTPVPRHNYRVGVAKPGLWHELLNTDSATFGGSGQGNLGAAEAMPVRSHGRELSLAITVPPLGAVWFTAS